MKVHIGFSNEVWNGMFPPAQYAQAESKELHLGAPERPWEGGAMYHTRRLLEVFKIFENEFGGTDRLVRIIAWQAATSEDWTDGIVLGQPGVAGHVDALAIAPYMTFFIPPTSTKDQPGANQVAGSRHSLCTAWEKRAAPINPVDEESKGLRRQERVEAVGLRIRPASRRRLGGENNDALTKLFQAANRDPRMGQLYTKYLDAWKATGGNTLCIFSSESAERW